MAPLTPEEKILDGARMQLVRISTAIQTLKVNLETTDPLPSWASLQSSFVLLSQSLKSIQDVIANNSAFLSSAQVYPNPHFPAQTQEAMLHMLLRKKLDPSAEDWIAEGQKEGSRIGHEDEDAEEDEAMEDGEGQARKGRKAILASTELKELWSWAGPTENEMARKMLDEETLNDFTFEEQERGVEHIATGIKRKLWESDSEDEDDEGGKMVGVEKNPKTEEKAVEPPRPVLPMDTIFRYMSTGKLTVANVAISQVQRR
ncbi:hypothetical protein EV356DRAFT_455560 [Viridothelium virens]|uniref:Mediator of RNA polymerase II transcription subunit 8 n=1 Tax=Viridothelium virens TaxID=1048519 RepID=A0A6A6GVD8_VIRVR|nr:hypothetical protein EV356DRAFT_455560 [Viridothelium virens]